MNAALLTVPAALLWGLLRSRLARGGLADLFRELGTLRGVRLEAGLAKALGDPGLVLAYRVPGEHSYIDGRGQPVDAARPGVDRAAAPVERDGRELAMLVYDASLDDDPELVAAVAAAAAIALDDARLQAESEDRLAELRASRERIVAAGDAERRRLERNLHDGAQQRLVSVALQLRMIQRRIRTDPALAERAGDGGRRRALGVAGGAARARARDPSRGAQPRPEGRARLAGVARERRRPRSPSRARSGCPSRWSWPPTSSPARRWPTSPSTPMRRRRRCGSRAANGVAVIEIADDGVGGADETAGTGLQGLADRVAALDGTLRILSPPGAGTVVTAELPCAS